VRARAPLAGAPVGWPDLRRPIPLAVLGVGGAPASAGDSAAFWGIARTFEHDWGARLFRPVDGAEARADAWAGIAVRVTPGLAAAGYTTVSWNGDGEVYDALIEMRTRALLGDALVVAHELLHAMGFGHASSWGSVLAGEPHPVGASPERLTAEDVAYAQLLDAARRIGRREGARYGLAEAERAGSERDAAGCD
jgi:hypothetical protein